MKLVTIGDNVVDFYQNKGVLYPGGNAVNVAVASKRIGAETSAYLGIMGNDQAAAHITRCLTAEEINMDRIRTLYGESGEAVISITEDGDRIFISTNKGIRVQSLVKLSLTSEDINYINQYDLIHMSVNSDTEHLLPQLAHKVISFDFSTVNRWNSEYLNVVCPYINFAFFSGSDMSGKQIEELITKVHDRGVEIVGVTRGEKAAIFSKNNDRFQQLPLKTNIIDTMGAGDSFIGTFLTVYHERKNMQLALAEAAKAAAITCNCPGAFGYGIEKEKLASIFPANYQLN